MLISYRIYNLPYRLPRSTLIILPGFSLTTVINEKIASYYSAAYVKIQEFLSAIHRTALRNAVLLVTPKQE